MAIDGVALASASSSSLAQKLGRKAMLTDCPQPDGHAVCALRLRMMPSARIEVVVQLPFSSVRAARLVSYAVNTGPTGDTWPFAKLAHVAFRGASRVLYHGKLLRARMIN